MPAFVLALLLVVLITASGWSAIAYLFPHHSSKD